MPSASPLEQAGALLSTTVHPKPVKGETRWAPHRAQSPPLPLAAFAQVQPIVDASLPSDSVVSARSDTPSNGIVHLH